MTATLIASVPKVPPNSFGGFSAGSGMKAYGPGARGVQGRHEVLDRDRSVVLDLHQADDVRAEPLDGLDDLRLLPRELLGGIRAARVIGRRVDGREIVQRVEAGDADVAANGGRRRGPRVGARERDRRRRLQPVDAEAEAQDAGHAAGRIANPHDVRRQERDAVHGRVLDVRVVVDQQAPPVVLGLHGIGVGARIHAIRRLEEPPVGRDHDFAEAPELEVLRGRQRLGEREEHPFERLEGLTDGHRQVVGGRGDGCRRRRRPRPARATAG